jgi:hypothetical protein
MTTNNPLDTFRQAAREALGSDFYPDDIVAALEAAAVELANSVIGEDSPLNPTPDAIGQPGIDPAKWREWSIVENHLRELQRAALGGKE